MSKRVKVQIMGQTFSLQTDEDEAYIEGLAKMVDERIADLRRKATLPPHSLAVLVALTLADDWQKERAGGEKLRDVAQQRTQALIAALESVVVDSASPS